MLTLGLFIHFSKAFDRINHEILTSKLNKYGTRGIPLDLVKSYLRIKDQSVTIEQ